MAAVTQELRKKVTIKAFRPVLRGVERTKAESPYREGVKICLERARLLTESYKQTEGQPMVLRRAKALAYILENMTTYIQDKELIVGNFASTPESLPTYPEFYWRWLEKAVQPGGLFAMLVDEESRRELMELNKYWRDKSVQGKERDVVPERIAPHWRYKGAMMWGHYTESGVPDFETIFKIGLSGLSDKAKAKLEEIEADTTLMPEDYIRKRNTLQAMIIALEAAIKWNRRYASLARELAAKEINSQRKKELEKIAEVCEWVPGNPPRNIHEAVQGFFTIHIIQHLIELHQNGVGVRMDQLLYPIYKKERDEGKITREEAQTLLEFLWIKMEEAGVLLMPMIRAGFAGNTIWQTLTIGGITTDGEDATNEMSYIILDASLAMRIIQPSLALRYHDKLPHDFILKAIDVMHTGVGYPAFFNDKAIIPLLMERGIPLEDARNYGIEACVRWTIPGKSMAYRAIAGTIVLPKWLELALNQGIDKFSGEQIGVATPDPLTFTSVKDVMDAFLAQVDFFTDKITYFHNTADALYREWLPRPFLSSLLPDCIQRGEDCRQYSYYHKSPVSVVGPVNVANSIAALKSLVFEDGKVTMKEFLDAVHSNWEGKEELRQMALQAPKFGNDDDYVDDICKEVQFGATKIIRKHKNHFGLRFLVDGTSSSTYYGYSSLTGASPEGRKDREPIADGTISPQPGTDVRGPTAILKSASKVDPVLSYNQLLNPKFLPLFLEGENRETFASYLKSWAALGIYHIQFNVVDRNTLLEAQKHPEQYQNLIVRVAGYSAYFIDLDEGLQNQIIIRTEQNF